MTAGHNDAGNCIFCAITAGKIPSVRVCESDTLVAFLDIHPIRPGHTLIVPKAHYAYFDDLPPDLAAEVMHVGQRLGRAMKRIYDAPRAAFAMTGSDVPHVHAHVLPVFNSTDITSRAYIVEENLTFHLPPTPPAEAMQADAERIRAALG